MTERPTPRKIKLYICDKHQTVSERGCICCERDYLERELSEAREKLEEALKDRETWRVSAETWRERLSEANKAAEQKLDRRDALLTEAVDILRIVDLNLTKRIREELA